MIIDLCYQDSDADSPPCLEAVRDENGKLMGIRNLDSEMVEELLGDVKTAYPNKFDSPVLQNDSSDMYVVMEATQISKSCGITA